MSRVVLTDPDPGLPLGRTRAQVWSRLQEAGSPLGVSEIAGQVGLHPNTARFHLDALVEAGLAERAVEDRKAPGRPRSLYTARPDAAATGRSSYRLLAEILTSYMAAEIPQPAAAAMKAGNAWGRYLADKAAPFQRIDAAAAAQQLVSVLDDIGFAPEAVSTGGRRRIVLHRCPFRETAMHYGDVVCSIHLGLMQGLLAELDAPLQAERLEPFVNPSVCVAHLRAKRDPAPDARPKPTRRRS